MMSTKTKERRTTANCTGVSCPHFAIVSNKLSWVLGVMAVCSLLLVPLLGIQGYSYLKLSKFTEKYYDNALKHAGDREVINSKLKFQRIRLDSLMVELDSMKVEVGILKSKVD